MDAADYRHYTVDRLGEDGSAHVEDESGRLLTLPAAWLPEATAEGVVLSVRPSALTERLSAVIITIDEAATKARREAVSGLREQLARGPEGDLEL